MKMDYNLSAIRVGTNVDIQRTDGRIHSAIVSGVNLENKSVSVEWFEKGETKGKEIELEAIFALNPDLAAETSEVQQPPKNIFPPQPPRKLPVRQVNAVQNNKVRQSYAKPLAPHQQQNDHSDYGIPNIQPSQNHAPAQPAVVQKTNPSQTRNRRSNCVKEVEKLKKDRETRRVRQAEQKAVKQELMNNDPGNPNWEFLGMIKDYRASLDYSPMTQNEPVVNQQICVAVRKRPLNKKENSRKEIDVVTVPNAELIAVHEPKLKVDLTKYLENQMFRFDYAFDESTDNELVYKYTAKPLVMTIFEGGMATCFAYGQTGSGKTHTMGGDFHGKSQDCAKGIYALVGKYQCRRIIIIYYEAAMLNLSEFTF
ncbi:KIF2A (predicted) [Pycnogonum litorale]